MTTTAKAPTAIDDPNMPYGGSNGIMNGGLGALGMGEGYGADGGGMGDGGARHTWTGSRRMPPTLQRRTCRRRC